MNLLLATIALVGTTVIHGEQQFLRGNPDGGHDLKHPYRRALNFEKLNAAQKRQNQRDYRRQFTNPFRTQAEEDAERVRKHTQGLFDPTRDPENRQFGFHEYAYYREKARADQCKLTGVGCNYHALEFDNVDKQYDIDPWHGEHYSGTLYDHDVNNWWNN